MIRDVNNALEVQRAHREKKLLAIDKLLRRKRVNFFI